MAMGYGVGHIFKISPNIMKALPKKLSGNGSGEVWLNQLRECVLQRTPLPSAGVRFNWGQTGFTIDPMAKDGGGGTGIFRAVRCEITQLNENYLHCEIVDEAGVNTGEPIIVAKSPILRGASPRTVPMLPGNGTIVQEVHPPFELGETILAIQPEGKTDVPYENGTIEWLDVTVGRHWRTTHRLLCVTIDGVKMQSWVQAGPPFSP